MRVSAALPCERAHARAGPRSEDHEPDSRNLRVKRDPACYHLAIESGRASRRRVLGTALSSLYFLGRVRGARASSQLRLPTREEQEAIAGGLRAVQITKAPVLLRLAFHDAGTFSVGTRRGGANGSIRFELDRPESSGLKRGWRVVEEVKKALTGVDLSYADLIALSGAHAVELCGGPRIDVPIGRADASEADPENMLPSEDATIGELVASFARMGLSLEDMVTLAGSHTLGGKGFGDPLVFDNAYYSALLERPWESTDSMKQMVGLQSDHVLPDDARCRKVIEEFAASQQAFHAAFARSYLKMTALGA